MSTEADDRLDRLFAEARARRCDTSVLEMNFETRVMAGIRERREKGAPWYAPAWRMLPAFAVIAAIIAICSMSFDTACSLDPFAAITTGREEYVAKAFLTGE